MFQFLFKEYFPVQPCAPPLAVTQHMVGFTLGNVVGMYLAQNYQIPNIYKKFEEFKKDAESRKKPPDDRS